MASTPRVVVCLSGGVDSAVAAYLLRQQGYDVTTITFWFWSFPGAPDYRGSTKCCSLDAAVRAAVELGVPHEEINASSAFRALVVDDYVQRYRAGETPNPCGRCNRYLRFGLALEYAEKNGFEYVATGHHVRRVQEPSGRFSIRRGKDPDKDQTYFLYGLSQSELARLLFPIGEITKGEVFAVARTAGLSAAELPQSQDLCFAMDGSAQFLFEPTDLQAGPIVNLEGRPLGTHRGLPRYTIGQRRGLGIATAEPLYVIDIDPQRNTLVVGTEDALFSDGLCAAETSYVADPPLDGARIEAKIRYRSTPVGATFHRTSEDQFALQFDEPQRAVTPGQLAVLYDGDRLLGGGTILRQASC